MEVAGEIRATVSINIGVGMVSRRHIQGMNDTNGTDKRKLNRETRLKVDASRTDTCVSRHKAQPPIKIKFQDIRQEF